MNTNLDIHKAFVFASEKHKGQVDDDGKPYIEHLAQVVQILRKVTDNPCVLVAGYLHDTIEDTKTTYTEIALNFGIEVADLVNEVTHEGQADEKGYYFPRLKSKEAIMIKFADRLSNLSRMSSWKEDRQAHYLGHSKFWRSEPARQSGFKFVFKANDLSDV